MAPVIGSSAIITVAVIAIVYFWRRKIKSQENLMRITAQMEGFDEMEVSIMHNAVGKCSYAHASISTNAYRRRHSDFVEIHLILLAN